MVIFNSVLSTVVYHNVLVVVCFSDSTQLSAAEYHDAQLWRDILISSVGHYFLLRRCWIQGIQ